MRTEAKYTNTIYTIGHGNRKWEDILSALTEHRCKYLIDVRTVPRSKYNPDFNKETLETLCARSSLSYVFMGDTIGGRPVGDEFYTSSGHVSYDAIKCSPKFTSGINRLVKASQLDDSIFLMCSEADPRECHRTKLIGQSLKGHKIEVFHVDKDYSLRSQDEILSDITGNQPDLFGEPSQTSFSRGKYK
ncbi:DUF488 domain-containing protein [Paracoccus halophilus]|uniref:DUF488 domain-containing protein n=1 Tax=Paracoccus halophilus TaxID=376733 RepID=UPI00094571D0